MVKRLSKDYDRYNINVPRKHVKKSSKKPIKGKKGRVKGHKYKYKYSYKRKTRDGTKLKKSGTHKVKATYPKNKRN